MWTEPAMDRATLLVIKLLSLLVVASAGNGNFSTQNSSNAIAEATGQNQGTKTFICSVHGRFLHVSKRILSLKD